MSFSVELRRLRARVVGPAPVRRSAQRAQRSLPRAAVGDRAAGCARRGARSTSATTSGTTLGTLRRASAGYSRPLRAPLPRARSPPRSGRRRRSARSTSRPRTRSASSTNHGMLGFGRHRWRTVAAGASTYVRRAASSALGDRLHVGLGVRSLRRQRRRRRPADSTTGRLARFDGVVIATHADAGARAARGPDATTSAACSARSATPRTRPCCTPTSASCRAGPARARVVELPVERRHAADADVLPQPPAAPRRATRDYCVTLNRTAEIRPGPDPARVSRTTIRSSRSRASPRSAELPSAHRPAARRRTRAPTTATGSTRTASPPASRAARAFGACAGREVGALRRDADARPPHAARATSSRYPVSYFLLDLDELPELDRRLRALRGRTGRASSPSATPTTSTRARCDGEAGGVDLAGDPSTRARADAHPAPRARLRLQPGRPSGGATGATARSPCIVRRSTTRSASASRRCCRAGPRRSRYEQTEKRLHVSPFFGLDQTYDVRALAARRRALSVRMDVHEDAGGRTSADAPSCTGAAAS